MNAGSDDLAVLDDENPVRDIRATHANESAASNDHGLLRENYGTSEEGHCQDETSLLLEHDRHPPIPSSIPMSFAGFRMMAFKASLALPSDLFTCVIGFWRSDSLRCPSQGQIGKEPVVPMRYCRKRERPGGLWSCGRVLLLTLSVCSFGSAVAAQGEALPGYKVIVNGDVEGSTVPRALLADIFLKKIRRWGNGQAIVAVDQSLSSDVRQQFTRGVLGQGSNEVLNYWVKQIDKGVWPPKAMQSDVEVLTYVADTPGAIGYVSEDAALDGRNIKVLGVKAASDVPSP